MKSAEIKNADGSVGLYIDGEKTAPIFYALSDIPGSAANTYYAYKNIKAFGEAGINLVSIDAEIRDGWYKSSDYEWEAIAEEIASALAATLCAPVKNQPPFSIQVSRYALTDSISASFSHLVYRLYHPPPPRSAYEAGVRL